MRARTEALPGTQAVPGTIVATLAAGGDLTTEPSDPAEIDQLVSLLVVHRGEIDQDAAERAFVDIGWLGSPVDVQPGNGWRRVSTDLELPVTDGSGPAVRKSALLDVGHLQRTDAGLRVPVAWHSATLAPLFPVFAGNIEFEQSMLTLSGQYRPPFGRLGLLMDQALLHFVARRSGQALLARVAKQCAAATKDDAGEG